MDTNMTWHLPQLPHSARMACHRVVLRQYPPLGWGSSATVAHMPTVASRDLRNHTAEVLRQVSDGTRLTITVNGTPVAELGPVRATRRQFFAKADLVELVTQYQADPGLTADLEVLAGETTDDLGVL